MKISAASIPDVRVLTPLRHEDARGFFCETYVKARLDALGGALDFVQDNHSLSVDAHVLRGLHFQLPPHAQDKLVRCVRGAILDVAVDVRRSSPTFGRHVETVLSAENWVQLLIPKGFAHGFLTLEPNTEVIYKVTDYYAPGHERGILWSDPALGVDWPVPPGEVILSEKDAGHPRLAEVESLFE